MRGVCPYLPPLEHPVGVTEVHRLRGRYDGVFYLACLRYAQSLWQEGKPAQALLQLNRAFTAELYGEEAEVIAWPLPYEAMEWILSKRRENEFLGNPVRHFQHLATRMSGPRIELRRWRAWACFHLAETVLVKEEFPRDEEQIVKEALSIPTREEVCVSLGDRGLPGEEALVRRLI